MKKNNVSIFDIVKIIEILGLGWLGFAVQESLFLLIQIPDNQPFDFQRQAYRLPMPPVSLVCSPLLPGRQHLIGEPWVCRTDGDKLVRQEAVIVDLIQLAVGDLRGRDGRCSLMNARTAK